jgi:hypothetical protein
MMENILPARTITALLPLFREHANTPAMIHHAMLLIKKQTMFLNPGKYPTRSHTVDVYFMVQIINIGSLVRSRDHNTEYLSISKMDILLFSRSNSQYDS